MIGKTEQLEPWQQKDNLLLAHVQERLIRVHSYDGLITVRRKSGNLGLGRSLMNSIGDVSASTRESLESDQIGRKLESDQTVES